jgi:hypothetical protein
MNVSEKYFISISRVEKISQAIKEGEVGSRKQTLSADCTTLFPRRQNSSVDRFFTKFAKDSIALKAFPISDILISKSVINT